MLRDLFVNSTIVITFICLLDLAVNQKLLNKMKPISLPWIYGGWAGLLGIVLMEFGIRVNTNTFIDLRHLAGMLAAMNGGFPAVGVAAVFMSAGRLWLGGFNVSSVAGVVGIIITSVGFGLISKGKWATWKKWLSMLIVALVVYTTVISTVILPADLYRTIPLYWLFTFLAGIPAYYLIVYFKQSRQLFQQLEEYSHTDYLTGLNNVRSFSERFSKALDCAKCRKELLSLILLDIDHFKKVNDTYGHAVGDLILAGLSPILKECCRSYDIVSRNGGEEFSVLLPNCPHAVALEIAERIRHRVAEHIFVLPTGEGLQITISAGVVTYPETAADSQSLYEEADKALYQAKHEGRNRVVGKTSASAL